MKLDDKKFSDMTLRDVRRGFWSMVFYFLLGCVIGIFILLILAHTQ